MSLSPAGKIATTVAKAMAERGDDVGPNVTLVLLAEIEASQARIARLEQVIEAAREAEANGWEDFSLQGFRAILAGLPAPTGKEK